MMRRVRGFLGLIVLVGLGAGLPWALTVTIGNPLHQWASITAGDMSDRDVIAIMAAIAYVAWATFAVALIAELVETVAATLSSRPRRQFRIPLLGVQQDLARTLIAAVLLLAPVAISVVGPTASAFAAPPPPSATASAPSTVPEARATADEQTAAAPSSAPAVSSATMTTYVIPDAGGMRSYWDLAAHYLGNGQRWQEVWQVNEGRVQDDGSVMVNARQLYRGWTVLVPLEDTSTSTVAASADSHEVVVRPGDTVSGLAAEDGVTDWTRVWAANADRAEPGGQHLTDPHLIKPGWTITLPGPTTGVAAGSTPHSAPPAVTPPPTPEPAHREPAPTAQPGSGTTTPARPGLEDSTAAHSSASRSADTHASDAAVHQSQSEIVSVAEWVASIGGGSGVLAGGIYLALRRHRRRQFRHRRPGRMIAGPRPKHVPLEKVLITTGSAAVRDVDFIDRALRALAASLAGANGRLPAVVAARLTSQHLDLVLADAQLEDPPAPWVAVSPTSWVVEKSADLPALDEYEHLPAAPYPTLVSVGYTPAGEEWLIDLEQAGALAFEGDPERCLDLARFAVAELAHNLWSDHLTVILAGFGEDLVSLNPGRLTHTDDIAAAAAAAAAVAAGDVSATRSVEDAESTDVLHGRLHGLSGDTWMPQVLIVAPTWTADADGASAVNALLESLGERRGRAAVAVVLTGDCSAAASWGLNVTVHADGTLLIPELDVIAAAQQLPADQAEELATYLGLARDSIDDIAMPAAADEGGAVAVYADLAGALLPEHTVAPAPAGVTSISISPTSIAAGSVRAHGDVVVPVVAPPAPGVCTAVEAADSSLDADLAAWYDSSSPRRKLRLLGQQVQLEASGARPDKYKTALVVEAVTYLALHPRGVTGDRFAADFWPEQDYTIKDSNPKNTLSLAGTWLGTDPVTGQRYLPYAKSAGRASGTALYRLNGVLVDADLFRRLRTRGRVRGGAAGQADYLAAMSLVGGKPLEGLRPQGGSWLILDEVANADILTAAIVDLAAEVVDYALAAGRISDARMAAQTAKDTGTASDRPLIDLARVCEAEGRHAELVSTVRQIRAHHDAEVEEDIPAHTYEELLRRGYIGIAS